MRSRSLRSAIGLHASIFFLLLSSNLFGQNQNNLVSNSDARAAGTRPRVYEPKKPVDPADVKTFSDEQLDSAFDIMVAGYSKDAVLFNNIGAAFYERKMYDKAESAVRHAIVLNNHPAFLTNLSIVYDTLGRLNEAITAAQRAVSQSPRYTRARNQLCELMLVSKRNTDTLLCYDELRKIEPLDPLAQTYYSVALVKSGSPDKAISMLTPLTKGSLPTALMFNALGNAYYAKKRYSQAADAFKQGVEIDPDNAQLRYNLAITLTAANNRAGALSQYGLMKEKDPALADQLYRVLYRDKIIYVDDPDSKKK
jgi:tetratricopeptide (TPR) repeat protein